MLCEVLVKLSVGPIFSTHHDDKQHLGSACVGIEKTVFGNLKYLLAVIGGKHQISPEYWMEITQQETLI